jgi:small-conductance mechanosensitive channel
VPGHHELSDLIHSTFTTVPLQLLATIATLAVLAGVAMAVRAAGSHLKKHLDSALVESLQAGFLAVFTALLGVFLITVWEASGLVQRGFEQINPDSGDIVAAALSFAVLFGAYALTRVSKNTVRRLSQQRGAITNHQQEVTHHVVQSIVLLLAVLVVFGIWGVDPGDLIVGAGVATVVFGLAARQTLGAVLAGFVVLFSRPFELGDWVQIGEKEGIVTDISIVNTQLRTFDEEYVMIPNDIVTDTEVTNRSRKGRLRLETDVGVDYTTDVEEAMEIAAEAMAGTNTPMARPDPHVVLAEFGDSSVVLRLRYYIDNPSARKMWKARTEVISAVKAAFAEAGIKIPFPQRELTGREESGGLAVTGVSARASEDVDESQQRVERNAAETRAERTANEAGETDRDAGDGNGDDGSSDRSGGTDEAEDRQSANPRGDTESDDEPDR